MDDTQARSIAQASYNQDGCQWWGPGVDPRNPSARQCGCKVLEGSAWCGKHYWKVYKRGSVPNSKRREAAIDREIAELNFIQEMMEAENG
jgi:hypothetical protein